MLRDRRLCKNTPVPKWFLCVASLSNEKEPCYQQFSLLLPLLTHATHPYILKITCAHRHAHRHAHTYTFIHTHAEEGDLYPYLLVNIGSGVSMVKVTGESEFERVSGSSLGGGTFSGLCRLLTQRSDFDEMLELSMQGDNSKAGWSSRLG